MARGGGGISQYPEEQAPKLTLKNVVNLERKRKKLTFKIILNSLFV